VTPHVLTRSEREMDRDMGCDLGRDSGRDLSREGSEAGINGLAQGKVTSRDNEVDIWTSSHQKRQTAAAKSVGTRKYIQYSQLQLATTPAAALNCRNPTCRIDFGRQQKTPNYCLYTPFKQA